MSPQIGEVAREMASGPVQSVKKSVAVLWVHIGAVLIGSIALARLAVIEGK